MCLNYKRVAQNRGAAETYSSLTLINNILWNIFLGSIFHDFNFLEFTDKFFL